MKPLRERPELARRMLRTPRALVAALLLSAVAACGDLRSPTSPALPAAETSPPDPPAGEVVPTGGQGWRLVTSGRDHTCALTASGEAYCWGSNAAGQLGASTGDGVCGPPAVPCGDVPVRVATALRFRTISAGGRHTCAVATDGAAYCWGDNARGQLGAPSPRLAGAPAPVSGGHTFVDISTGADHTCALRTDGVVYCWGANGSGQLGTGTFRGAVLPMPVAAEAAFMSVSAGSARTCGTTTGGAVLCWGNTWLATENGAEVVRRQAVPAAVPSAPLLRSVAVGPLSTCGTDARGAAYCWEANGFGQLGSGALGGSRTPVAVLGGLTFSLVAVGRTHTCGVTTSRRAYCWGSNAVGQLGNHRPTTLCGQPAFPCSPVPNPVTGSLRFTMLSTGLGSHVCGVTTLTNIYCWGLGVSGQLGIGVAGARLRFEPTLVASRAGDSSTDQRP